MVIANMYVITKCYVHLTLIMILWDIVAIRSMLMKSDLLKITELIHA